MQVCALKWCVALAAEGSDHCALHGKYPNLSPVELEPEEVERLSEVVTSCGQSGTPQMLPPCPDCKGMKDCEHCEGSGTFDCECDCGDVHDADCKECDGEGVCQTCEGTGEDRKGLNKITDPEWWRWCQDYREAVVRGRATGGR